MGLAVPLQLLYLAAAAASSADDCDVRPNALLLAISLLPRRLLPLSASPALHRC